MPDNTIRVGAVIDASQIPGGLDAVLSALAAARNSYNVTSAESAAALARLKQAHKDFDQATGESKRVAADYLSAMKGVYADVDLAAQKYKSQVQGLETVLAGLGAAQRNVAQATQTSATATNAAAQANVNLAGSAAAATAGLAATAGAAMPLGQIMAGAAVAARQTAPAVAAAGTAAGGAAIPMFRLFAVLMLIRRGLDALEKFRESEEDLRNFSAASGIAVDQLARFQAGITQAGGDGEKFGQVILHLGEAMEKAQRGNATMADELHRVGVSAKDPVAAFLQIADTVHNTRDRMEALEAAARVLGISEADLIGILSQGSAALREHIAAAGALATARAGAVDDTHKLTVVEQELKGAFETVAAASIPALIFALKLIGTAASGVSIAFKATTQTILLGLESAVDAAKGFGRVVEDLATGRWSMVAIDAKAALQDIRDDVVKVSHDIGTETADSIKFIQSLWANAKPAAADPGAGKPFPGITDKNALKKAETALRQADQEALADLEADHKLTIGAVISFWETRLQLEANYADRVREIKRTLGALYQRQDEEQLRDAEKRGKESAALMLEDIEQGLADIESIAGKAGGLQYLREQVAKAWLGVIDETEGALELYTALKKKLLAEEREAGTESEQDLKKGLEERFRLFEENGTKTLAQQKAFWAEAIRLATGWQELEYAESKYAETSRKAADDTRKLTEDLRNLKIAADEAKALQDIGVARETRRGQEQLRPPSQRTTVEAAEANKAFDVQEANAKENALYAKAQASDIDELTNPTREAIEANTKAWDAYQKQVDVDLLKIQQDNNAIAKAIEQPWQQAFQTFENGFNKAITDMLFHGKSFAQGMKEAFRGLAEDAVKDFLKMAESYTIDVVAMIAITKILRALGVDTSAANAAQKNAQTQKNANVQIALSDAAVAAANEFAIAIVSTGGDIPAATADAAIAYAIGAGFAAAASAEQGGIVPANVRSLTTTLHPKEMVLPAPISTGLQSMIAAGGANGSGGGGQVAAGHTFNVTHNNSFSSAGRMTDAELQEHAATLAQLMRSDYKRFNR